MKDCESKKMPLPLRIGFAVQCSSNPQQQRHQRQRVQRSSMPVQHQRHRHRRRHHLTCHRQGLRGRRRHHRLHQPQGRRRHRPCHRHHRLHQLLLHRNRNRRHRRWDRNHGETATGIMPATLPTPHLESPHLHCMGHHRFHFYQHQGRSLRLDRTQPHQYKMHHDEHWNSPTQQGNDHGQPQPRSRKGWC